MATYVCRVVCCLSRWGSVKVFRTKMTHECDQQTIAHTLLLRSTQLRQGVGVAVVGGWWHMMNDLAGSNRKVGNPRSRHTLIPCLRNRLRWLSITVLFIPYSPNINLISDEICLLRFVSKNTVIEKCIRKLC